MSAISVNYKGIEYPSLTALAHAFNIPESTVKDRWRRGIRTPEELIKSYQKSKPQLNITYQGTIYHTYNSLARACGINASTLRDRYNHGLRDEKLFAKPKDRKKRRTNQNFSINYKGKNYTTFTSLSIETGISKSTIRDRWNSGIRDPEKLIAPPDPKYQHKSVYVKQYEIVVRGEKYTSIASLARKYDLKPAVISKRIRDGKTGEDLIKPVRTFRKTSSIDYKGKHYQNLAEFARDNNLEYSIVYSRWKYGVHDAELLARPVKNNKLILNNISKKDAEKVARFLHERNLISTKELAEKVNFRVESLRNYSSRRSEAIKSIGLTPQDLVRVRFTPEEIRSLHNKAILPKYAFKPSAIKHINARSQKLASKNLVIIPQTDFKYFWDADKKEVYSCRNAKDKNIFYQVKKKENGIFHLRIRLKDCLFTKSDIEDLIKNPQIEWNLLISKKQITNSLKGMKELELIIKKALEIQHTRYDFDGHKHLGITEKELHKLLKKIKTND